MTQRVTLLREPFKRRAHGRGLDSQIKQARAIGVHASIHSRALKGSRDLSGPYVIGVLLTVGDDSTRELVEELFKVTRS